MRSLLLFVLFLGYVHSGMAKPTGRKSAPAGGRQGVETITVLPSETDPAIKTFDTPHFVYVNDAILVAHATKLPPARHELLLWIPGTQPPGSNAEGPGGAAAFCQLAADLGYHVIILKYPNDESASVCRDDSDPTAYEKFRLALIEGGKSPHLTISRSDSIEHRLIKLLHHLQRTRPAEKWEQFLDGDGIKWSAIAVAGQSQGGGHAALLGIKHRVARVICTGAPKDYSLALDAPAAWLTAESATPKDRFFAFNHQQDHQACSPAQQLANLRSLKLDAFGPPVDVDKESPPYRHSHILTTNYPGSKLTSKEAHTTVIAPRNEIVFGKAWTYLLTEKAP
jgi:hypothetical protein